MPPHRRWRNDETGWIGEVRQKRGEGMLEDKLNRDIKDEIRSPLCHHYDLIVLNDVALVFVHD
jgi:hypothetical protein